MQGLRIQDRFRRGGIAGGERERECEDQRTESGHAESPKEDAGAKAGVGMIARGLA